MTAAGETHTLLPRRSLPACPATHHVSHQEWSLDGATLGRRWCHGAANCKGEGRQGGVGSNECGAGRGTWRVEEGSEGGDEREAGSHTLRYGNGTWSAGQARSTCRLSMAGVVGRRPCHSHALLVHAAMKTLSPGSYP